MSQSTTETRVAGALSATPAERAASLRADGTQQWFIPPFVIPVVIVLLVAGRAIYLS